MLYAVDERDRVKPLKGVPVGCAGAPMPVAVTDDCRAVLAFGNQNAVETVSILTFQGVLISSLGWPNDEICHAHPLGSRGIAPYGAFEVLHSSWVRALDLANSGHPGHERADILEHRHFIWTFHDSTFECIARSFEVETGVRPGDAMTRIRHALFGSNGNPWSLA